VDARINATSRAAMTAPVANRTWEALTVLLAASAESDPITVSFPKPARVLAIYPSIAMASLVQGRVNPVLDDLLVELSLNEETRLTNRFDVVTQPSGTARTMVTMGAFLDTVGGARMLDIDLSGATNEVVIRYRWKVPVLAAASYNDVVLGMAFHAIFAEDSQIRGYEK
jgi:hypothetical protein